MISANPKAHFNQRNLLSLPLDSCLLGKQQFEPNTCSRLLGVVRLDTRFIFWRVFFCWGRRLYFLICRLGISDARIGINCSRIRIGDVSDTDMMWICIQWLSLTEIFKREKKSTWYLSDMLRYIIFRDKIYVINSGRRNRDCVERTSPPARWCGLLRSIFRGVWVDTLRLPPPWIALVSPPTSRSSIYVSWPWHFTAAEYQKNLFWWAF